MVKALLEDEPALMKQRQQLAERLQHRAATQQVRGAAHPFAGLCRGEGEACHY